MARENFLFQKEGRALKVIVNRPEQRNAFKVSMWFELIDIVKEIEKDPETMVLIITGAGEKSFVSGADISDMENFPPVVNGKIINPVAMATREIENLQKVVIAMINGFCIGGGCELAMACDLRVASESAQIGITSAKIGICNSFENIKRLVDLVGPSRAKDILFTGRLLSAKEAHSIGLVDYVVSPQELEGFTKELTNTILQNAPLSILGAKRTINILSRNLNMKEIEDEFSISKQCFASEDFREGVRAFLEKRRPQFKGM